MSKAVESCLRNFLCFKGKSLELVTPQNRKDLVRHVNSREHLSSRDIGYINPGKFHYEHFSVIKSILSNFIG